ncbi:MAG TPA: PAS domain S-box protein [Acidobacteriaceae bacterium]|nr:PAS domain S-box protein [Acidobacteriaceae bacterium]
MIEDAQDRSALRRLVIAAALAIIVSGAAMDAAWLTHAIWLKHLFPKIFHMKFGTALCFVLSGVGLLGVARGDRRVARTAAGLVLFFAGTSLIEYLTGINLGLDQLFVRDFDQPNIPYPGRMAPNTASAFALAGIAIVWSIHHGRMKAWRNSALELLGFLVFSLGAEGLLGHLQEVGMAYTWGSYTQMAWTTSVGFIALGLGLIGLAGQAQERQEPRKKRMPLWVPAMLCFLVLMVDIGTPRGVAAGIVYVPLIFCSLWYARPQTAFVFAVVATLLTVLVFFAKAPSEVAMWMVVVNRIVTILALWLTAVLVFLRRSTEQALKESEARDAAARKDAQEKTALLASIVESSDDAILSEDRSGIVTSWNRGAELVFGYSAAEMIGKNISCVIPEDRLQEEEEIRAAISCGERVVHLETLRLRKDGSLMDVSVTISPILGGDGELIGASKIARDISDRKQADERFRAVVESAPNSMVMVDRGGSIVLANLKTEELFGYMRQEILGQPIGCLIPERFRGAHSGFMASFFMEPQSRPMGAGRELFALRKDGIEVPIEIGLSAVKTRKGIFTLASIVDISKRKRAENELARRTDELMRSNRDLEQFAYVAYHDLQEPLRAVSGSVQLLQRRYRGQLDERADQFIGHAVDGALRMQVLIEDLLSYSRVSRAASLLQPVDCDAALDLALKSLSTAIDEADAEVTRDPLPTVMGIPTHLALLFQNLVGNAIKFRGEEQPGRIHVGAERHGREWLISVSDNGIGIDPQYFDRIFTIFQRLHTRREYPGTGIGLALCKRIVERHGGRIQVESEPGKGAKFSFNLRAV